MQLRPYQKEAIENIKSKFNMGINRCLVQLPTGMGKTPLFASLPTEMEFDKRMMVIVHREELAEQAKNKLEEWNPTMSVGIEMGDREAGDAQAVVASVQTIGKKNSKRIERFPPDEFDALTIDEAHHASAETYRNIIEHFEIADSPRRLLLGVTATPNRADGQGLGEVFDEIVYQKSILEGIREGWLADLSGVRVYTSTDLDSVHVTAGDLNLGELSLSVNTIERNDAVVRAWLDHGDDRQTVVFAVDVEHAKALAQAFKNYGIACEAIWGGDPDREAKLQYHKSGGLKVLVNCQLLTEGYDDWRIGCIVIARPTKSESLYTQMVGRGTRIPPVGNLVEARNKGLEIEKTDCIVIDVTDNYGRHSLVSLPTLFGLNKKVNLKGNKISSVMKEVEDAIAINPTMKVWEMEDIQNIKTKAEKISLFEVKYEPEVVQLSKYQWQKTGENCYVLLLLKNEFVCIIKDILDKWYIKGTVNGVQIHKTMATFEEAIQEADFLVGYYGGKTLQNILKQTAKWHNDPPTTAQLLLCKKMKIAVPPGATKGDVHKKLNQVLSQKKKVA